MLQATIEPKSTFCQFVCVNKPGSLIAVRFKSTESGIGFSIEKLGSLRLVKGER